MASSRDPAPTESPELPESARRAAADLARLIATELPAGLYVVATPIGNLADMTLRAIAVLARADLVLCEDTRHSRHLLDHYAITAKVRPYHEHNAEAERPRVLAALAEGKRVALISDAGTPLVSDPGYKLVRAAIEAGHHVEAIPGASAVLTALTVAGLPTDSFHFAGFLPAKQGARRQRLADLATIPATLVLFEAPSRLADALADMAEALGAREAAVTRELTKLYEEVRRGTLSDLAAWAREASPRGEMVVIVGPPSAEARIVTDDDIRTALAPLLAAKGLAGAAREVARTLDVPRTRVYDLGLALKAEGET